MRRFTFIFSSHLQEGIEFSDGHVAIWGCTGRVTGISQQEISIPGREPIMAGVLSFDNNNSLVEYEDIDDMRLNLCIKQEDIQWIDKEGDDGSEQALPDNEL